MAGKRSVERITKKKKKRIVLIEWKRFRTSRMSPGGIVVFIETGEKWEEFVRKIIRKMMISGGSAATFCPVRSI